MTEQCTNRVETETLVVSQEVLIGPHGLTISIIGELVVDGSYLQHIALCIIASVFTTWRIAFGYLIIIGISVAGLELQAIIDVKTDGSLSVETPSIVLVIALVDKFQWVLEVLCVCDRAIYITIVVVSRIASRNSRTSKPCDIAHDTALSTYFSARRSNIIEITRYVQAEGEALVLGIHIRTEAHLANTCTQHDTILVREVDGCHKVSLICTTRYRNVMLLHVTCSHNGIEPVCISIMVWI